MLIWLIIAVRCIKFHFISFTLMYLKYDVIVVCVDVFVEVVEQGRTQSEHNKTYEQFIQGT